MQSLLSRISELYVQEIPKTLRTVPATITLYAGFVPYFGWEADPEDHAGHSREIYILDTQYLDKIKSEGGSPDEVSRRAFGWGEFIGEKSITIESDDLHQSLLEWYTYQGEQDESTELLDQIGAAIASACRKLNEGGWSGSSFTSDFVVFTDCMADEIYNVGLPSSVPNEWLQSKRDQGMFQWLRGRTT
jgi:hypothetical protein